MLLKPVSCLQPGSRHVISPWELHLFTALPTALDLINPINNTNGRALLQCWRLRDSAISCSPDREVTG